MENKKPTRASQPTLAIENVGATHQALPPRKATSIHICTPSLVLPNRLPAHSIFQRAGFFATSN